MHHERQEQAADDDDCLMHRVGELDFLAERDQGREGGPERDSETGGEHETFPLRVDLPSRQTRHDGQYETASRLPPAAADYATTAAFVALRFASFPSCHGITSCHSLSARYAKLAFVPAAGAPKGS